MIDDISTNLSSMEDRYNSDIMAESSAIVKIGSV
jgi:hypothetical protein